MRTLALVLALLLAGCIEAPGGAPPATRDDVEDPEPWVLGGAWTEDHTQADIDAWCEIAKAYGNECLVMESFPPQYALRLAGREECEEARAKILALEHITARECHPQPTAHEEPDTPTSSPPQGSAWSLHGTFAEGYTADDIAAVCRAGTGNDTCAMMKSYPPQYSFRFASREACEEARAKILAVASARPGACVEVADG